MITRKPHKRETTPFTQKHIANSRNTTRQKQHFIKQFIHQLGRYTMHRHGGGRTASQKQKRNARVEDIRTLNREQTLHTHLFNRVDYPTDFDLVQRHRTHVPSQLQTFHDYQCWLDLQPHLSRKGKKRFKGLRDLAKEEFSTKQVKTATPTPLPEIETLSKPIPKQTDDVVATTYVPPHTKDVSDALPLDDQASDSNHTSQSSRSKTKTTKTHKSRRSSTASATDETTRNIQEPSRTSGFTKRMRDLQLKQTKEEKHHYEQMALKEADQRQLLMLLCGDVEADMFFDEDGQMRGPRQIIEQTLFLLEPYHMSNSKLGVWAKHIYFYTNYVWKYGTTVAALVVSIMSLYHIGLFMMMCTRTLAETNAYTNLVKGFLNTSTFIFIGLFNSIVSILSRQFKVSNTGATFDGRAGREFVRLLCVGGPPAMLWWFFTRTKVDYSNNEQLSVAMYCVRTLHDRHKQLDAMNYLAQLTPGFFGEDLSSGITNKQLGSIVAMQNALLKLDKDVDSMTEDQYATINVQYNKSGRGTGITERKIDLANVLNRHFNTALTKPVDEHTENELIAFRKTLLTTFKEDMRSFHFMDAYGHPRDKVGICKAYFVYWQMCEQSQRLPTIPYEGQDTFVEYLKLTPLQQLRTKRNTMKPSKNIPNTWWRQHPFLYKNDKTPIDLQEALRTEPSDVLSLFDYSNQKAIRKHRGWTHRIAQIGKENAIDRFHLNTFMLSKEYDLIKRKSSSERKKMLSNAEPIDTERWNEDRDTNVFEGGVRLQSPDSPKAYIPSQKPIN